MLQSSIDTFFLYSNKKAPDYSGAYVIFNYNLEHCKFLASIQVVEIAVKLII